MSTDIVTSDNNRSKQLIVSILIAAFVVFSVRPASAQPVQPGPDYRYPSTGYPPAGYPPMAPRYQKRPPYGKDYYTSPYQRNNWQPRERPGWNTRHDDEWRRWNAPEREYDREYGQAGRDYEDRDNSEWQSWDRFHKDLDRKIERMRRDMDRMFEESYQRHSGNRPEFQYSFHQDLSAPKMKIREDGTQYIITVKLPGADESDVSVSLDGQRLTVKGRRKSQKKNSDTSGNIVFTTRSSSNFQRSITLTEPVLENAMKTKVEDGVVTITIAKDKDPA